MFEKAIDEKDKETIDVLIKYIRDPKLIYRYAENFVSGKVEDELEDVIATDPTYSYWYAKYVLKGPFPKGENAIATSIPLSYDYAKNVLEGPFKAGENKIATSSYYSYYYAKDVLGRGPFIERESTIINSEWKDKYIQFLEEIGELEDFFKRHS